VGQMIQDRYQWSQGQLQKFVFQILIGLKTLHAMNIIHRDVKPSNIVYDERHDVYQLIDFGVSTKLSSTCTLNKIETLNTGSSDTLSLIGTVGYISPEMFESIYSLKKISYTERVDVFSFGVTLLEMILHDRAFIQDFDILSERIQKELSRRETTLHMLVNQETQYLHELHKKMEDLLKNRRLERLCAEIYEKITILTHLPTCELDERDTMLSELIDKNKSISSCCKKFREFSLEELDENACIEYEFISKTKTLYNFFQKMDSVYKNRTNDDWVHDLYIYQIVFMTADRPFPESLCNMPESDCKDFLQRCLHYDPKERWTIDQLLNHSWLGMVENLSI
jgi:serine/threonine protein kinase